MDEIIEGYDTEPQKNTYAKSYEAPPQDRWNIVTDQKFRMNSLLKRQLEILKNNVEYDFDSVVLVDGFIEGSGKSVLAQQMGKYLAWKCNNKFTVDNIIFTPKQFLEAVEKAEKYTSIVWDEAYTGGNKFRQMSSMVQTITKVMQKIRQKNLFIIIVLPYFFDLSPYLAMQRSWYLVHVIVKSQLEVFEEQEELDFNKPVFIRGNFEFFSYIRKKKLYLKGKTDYNYAIERPNFRGMFPKHYTVDEAAYKKKKAEFATDDDADNRMKESEYIQESLLRGMPISILKGFVSCSVQNLNYWRNKLTEAGKLVTENADSEEDDDDL